MPTAKRGLKAKKISNYFSPPIYSIFIADFLLALVLSVCQNLSIINNFNKKTILTKEIFYSRCQKTEQ
ncbi:hypothetical protein BH20ACI1_BH20ACI1_22990 [soil metagenome]